MVSGTKRKVEQAKKDIISLLTREIVCYKTEIERRLPKHNFRSINDAEKELIAEGVVKSRALPASPDTFAMKFFHLSSESQEKIDQISQKKSDLINTYSKSAFTAPLGDFGIEVIANALTKSKFIIIDKKSYSFNNIHLTQDDGDLDIIAFKKGQFFGIEVKNKKAAPTSEELQLHLNRCNKVKILKPVIISVFEYHNHIEFRNFHKIATAEQYVEDTPENALLVDDIHRILGYGFVKLVKNGSVPIQTLKILKQWGNSL